jgi:hypothetical protein
VLFNWVGEEKKQFKVFFNIELINATELIITTLNGLGFNRRETVPLGRTESCWTEIEEDSAMEHHQCQRDISEGSTEKVTKIKFWREK